jgi:hypothetical protein
VAYGYTLFFKYKKLTNTKIIFDKMIRITENEMFSEIDALPSDWSFIIEPNQEIETLPIVQIKVKCNKETRRIPLNPSTLSGEYSLVQLNRSIISIFNLTKNSSLELFCNQINRVIKTDSQLLQAIKTNSKQIEKTDLQIDVSISKQEDPCLLCLSFECSHKISQRSSIKKRKVEEHDTLLPEVIESAISRKQELAVLQPKTAKKRRLVHLSSSMPKLPVNSSFGGVTSSFFPFEVSSF